MPRLEYDRAWTAGNEKYVHVAEAMMALLLKNVATTSRVLQGSSGRRSRPGCIIASPSFPSRPPSSADVTDQDYVFHWVRDGAISAFEMACWPDIAASFLGDYVAFCRSVQLSGTSIGFACFRVDATARDGTDPLELRWSEQSDGPALRICSILKAWPFLDASGQNTGRDVILQDVRYLLDAYRLPTRNLWEECVGYSFFVRSVHLRAFNELLSLPDLGISGALDRVQIATAIQDLQNDLATHWNEAAGRYDAVLSPSDPRGSGLDVGTIMAAIYGAAPVTDSRMMATFFAMESFAAKEYPINHDDHALNMGPLIGRYPGDIYDGDWAEPNIGHPWALCTNNAAEYLYYLAAELKRGNSFTIDSINAPFYGLFGVHQNSGLLDVIGRLIEAGDRILDAVLRHANQLHLSEQFDRNSGFEKSVRDLTWSYASFASAVRARQAAA